MMVMVDVIIVGLPINFRIVRHSHIGISGAEFTSAINDFSRGDADWNNGSVGGGWHQNGGFKSGDFEV